LRKGTPLFPLEKNEVADIGFNKEIFKIQKNIGLFSYKTGPSYEPLV
jgi:hypothetical protein